MQSERCSKCVLPSCVVPLSNGVCYQCSNEDHNVNYKGEAELIKVLDHYKKIARQNGNKYDCLVSISGGKDSTYTLLKLVTKYDMNVLGFTYEHSFSDEQAIRNVNNAVKILGIDLIRNTDDKEQKRYLKHNILKIATQHPENISRLSSLLCVGCSQGYVKKANEIAKINTINLIMQGGSPVEPDMRFFERGQVRDNLLKSVMKEIGEVLSNPIFYDLRYYKNIPHQMASSTTNSKYVFNKILQPFSGRSKISRHHFFDYIEWNENEIISTLENELEWRRPIDRKTTTRFDCAIHILLDTLRLRYLGISDKELMYSIMVRKKMLSRDEAVNRTKLEIEEEERLLDKTLRDILAILNESNKYDEVRQIWDKSLYSCGWYP
jgi:hypothetical protein